MGVKCREVLLGPISTRSFLQGAVGKEVITDAIHRLLEPKLSAKDPQGQNQDSDESKDSEEEPRETDEQSKEISRGDNVDVDPGEDELPPQQRTKKSKRQLTTRSPRRLTRSKSKEISKVQPDYVQKDKKEY